MTTTPITTRTLAPRLLALSLLAGLFAPSTSGEEVLRLRPTHTSLRKQAEAGARITGDRHLLEPLDPRNRVEEQRPGILERSTILSFNGFWTLVPRGAVLHLPPAYADRIVAAPEGTLLPWPDFCTRNRGWLHIQPVRLSDALGETDLSEDTREANERLGRVVVAVFRGGPISVSAPKARTSH